MYIKSANYGWNIVTSFGNPFVLGWAIGICSLKSSYYTNYDKYVGQMYSVVHSTYIIMSCPCDIPLHSPKLKVFQIHIVFNPIKILYPTMWTFGTEYCGMVNSVHPQYFSQCFKCGILWPIVFPQYMSWKDIVQLRILQATRQLWMPILMGPPQFLSMMPMRKDLVTTLTFESKVGKSCLFTNLWASGVALSVLFLCTTRISFKL